MQCLTSSTCLLIKPELNSSRTKFLPSQEQLWGFRSAQEPIWIPAGFLAEAEKTVHDRNGRTVMVHFCWLCYPPTEVLINANCKRGQLYTPWCMIRTTVLATNESKQQLSSLLLKLEPTHKHTPKKQRKKTHIGAELKV